MRAYVDRLAASDPGLNRLVTSVRVLVGVGVTIAVEYGFMHATHALWTTAPAQQRSITLLAMLLGGIVAMMSALAVTDPTPRGQAVTLVWLPVPLLAMMALSITLSSHHTLGLVVLAVVMGAGTYARKLTPRFGPRAFLYGALLFIGYFFGFLAGAEIPLHDLGWVSAILWVAVVINLALRLLADVTVDRRAVARTARGFDARARRVAGAAARLLAADTSRARQRIAKQLARRLARLNEAALMIDGQLINATLTSTPPGAWTLHRRVFDAELALQSIGRLTQRLARSLAPEVRIELLNILRALRLGHDDEAESLARGLTQDWGRLPVVTDAVSAARVQALAAVVIDTSTALRARSAEDDTDQSPAANEPFTSPVKFTGGNLSGSGQTSAAAVDPGQRKGRLSWLTLDAPARTAIRVTLAVGAACALGSRLSERRFYWAVIAVFIAFMGANTAAEQIIKAANRVVGTVVGILLGSLIATAVGPGPWSLAVILPALAIGVYFQRVSYALMVTGVTIMVAQLYVLLGEYSSSLLTLRLEETAIGAAIAMLASLLILPVRTRRATRFAIGACLDALADLLDHLASRPDCGEQWGVHSGDQRALDDAVQQLFVTARPLAHDPFRSRRDLEPTLGLIETAAYHARTVVAITAEGVDVDPQLAGEVHDALCRQHDSVNRLSAAVRGYPEADGYEPIANELEAIEGRLAAQNVAPEDPERRSARALARLDETLVALASELQIDANETVRKFGPNLSALVAGGAVADYGLSLDEMKAALTGDDS
jgi:uncharacterized membrane protein YccC